MSALSAAKAALIPGTTWNLTNHYINAGLAHNDGYPRTDRSGDRHPAYAPDGTHVTVERITTGRVYFVGGRYLNWPKAGQVQRDEDGTVRLHGGGGQSADELFVTLEPTGGLA